VRQLCREGISVLWTTHLLDEVQPSDDLLILHQGRLVASARADAVSQAHGGTLGSAFTHLTAAGVHP
jgi:ABC-2 type transport system ATP-binding protein